MTDCSPRSKLADDSSRWLPKYPAHLVRTWRLASGESFSLRPVRQTMARSKKRSSVAFPAHRAINAC